MAALVAVMIMVSVATFDWHSVRPATLKRMSAGETTIMVVAVAAVVATHNLAIGVVLGSVTAMVVFAKRVARLAHVSAVIDPDGPTRMTRTTSSATSPARTSGTPPRSRRWTRSGPSTAGWARRSPSSA